MGKPCICCAMFGIELKVLWLKSAIIRSPIAVSYGNLGAKCVPSPSLIRKQGVMRWLKTRKLPEPRSGYQRSCWDAVTHEGTLLIRQCSYHVLLHQTIIGRRLWNKWNAGCYPDIVIGCVGGGSNFGGIALPFLKDKLSGKKKNLRCIAVTLAARL